MIKRKFDTKTFVGLIILHLAAGYSVWRWYEYGYTYKAWITFFCFWSVIATLGSSIGSHRYFTHATFKCPKLLQYIMAGLHGMALQGPLMTWVIDHDIHHAFVDVAGKDPHTPYEYGPKPGLRGSLWSHCVWTWHEVIIPNEYSKMKLLSIKNHTIIAWEKKWHFLFSVLSFILPFIIAGWDGLWLAGVFRIVFSLHATWLVNSWDHIIGSRAKDANGNIRTKDQSRNSIFVVLLTFGEGWHANHHAFSKSAIFHKFFDIGAWVIFFLESLGFIEDVGRAPTLVK